MYTERCKHGSGGGYAKTAGESRYGVVKWSPALCVDYRLFVNEGKASMSLRDYCDAFDPMAYYDIHNKGNAEDSFGIRLVMKLAKDIRYINTFNSNCLFINLEV